MEDPVPALAPDIPPVIVPTVQLKLPGIEEVRLIFEPVPLHIVVVPADVTIGAGLTVTMIVKGVPGHEPVVEVGVTTYATVPVRVLLGLVST